MINKSQNSRIIGLLVNDMATDFSKGVIHGVAEALAGRKDICLVVLAGLYDNGGDINDAQHCYKTVYNNIYRVAELCDLDGLIFSLDRIGLQDGWIQGQDYLAKYMDIPKIVVAADDQEGYVSVNFDNETGVREAVDCMVNVHGLTNICMLGGRDDNRDAQLRRAAFTKCLAKYGIELTEDRYERSDMSINSEEAANRLLDRNPDVQAIFCVNDATAMGLYIAMDKHGLVPGRDIMVVGFDNTHMSENMLPPLTSIGTDTLGLGQKAAQLMLEMLDGREVHSEVVRTRLYGRESLIYENYEYTAQELEKVDPGFIDRMFDDCFYRFSSTTGREQIDLRHLFNKFISKMLQAINKRYMEAETYDKICRMIDVFFENGAMLYTDSAKLLKSIDRLQGSINQSVEECATLKYVNRLFTRIRDRAISEVSVQRIKDSNTSTLKRDLLHNFVVSTMDFSPIRGSGINCIIRNIDKLGLRNASLCLYREPVRCGSEGIIALPELIDLCCIIKDGEPYMIPEDRRKRRVKDLFTMHELFARSSAHAVFPVFYGLNIYGLLICDLTDEVYDNGEFNAAQIGLAIYTTEPERMRRSAYSGADLPL